jgi:hypothetical protein
VQQSPRHRRYHVLRLTDVHLEHGERVICALEHGVRLERSREHVLQDPDDLLALLRAEL